MQMSSVPDINSVNTPKAVKKSQLYKHAGLAGRQLNINDIFIIMA
jgi:hypothetical protein